MGKDITEICGEKVASDLSEMYGDGARRVIEDLDVLKLMQVPGLGIKKATSIIRKAYSERFGNGFESILGGNAEKVYESIFSILRSHVVTDEAKDMVYSYFPVREMETIVARSAYLEDAARSYEALRDKYGEISSNLKRIEKLRDPPKRKYYDYVILTDSNEAEPLLKNPLCDTLFVSSPSDAEYARNSYSFVIYVYGNDSELSEHIEGYADIVANCDGFMLGSLIPDGAVERFVLNEGTLRATYNIRALFGDDIAYLRELLSLIGEFKDKDRLSEKKVTPEEFIDMVKLKERELNRKITKSFGESGVGMKADKLLDIFTSMSATEDPTEVLKQNLPPELNEIYGSLLKETLAEIEGASGIDASDVFPDSFNYPIAVDTERLYALRNKLESIDFRSQYDLKRRIASFEKRQKDIQDEIIRAFELDFMLGMGRFISENRCTMPRIIEGGTSFVDGRSLLVDNPRPVSYKIGRTGHGFTTDDNVAVLTGANSGGKTTLLETVLCNQILTQMGFLVPAEEMQTAIYDSIRYLAKAKSQNAGAFETTIRSLVPLATEKGKRLILIDELESITEPGSAARIIAALIDVLKEREGSCCIIVTHLGEEISKLCEVRVDGIEASGLDDELNLIVNRQPEFGKIGKSTPELIVEKLFRMSKGETKKVYERMLKRLKDDLVET